MMSAFALIDEANSALAQNSTYAVYASGLVLTLAMLAFCVDLAQTPGRKERVGEAAAHAGDEDAAAGTSATSSRDKSAGGATAVLERTETHSSKRDLDGDGGVRCAEFGGAGLGQLGVPVGDGDAVALRGQALSGGPADTGCPTDDDGVALCAHWFLLA